MKYHQMTQEQKDRLHACETPEDFLAFVQGDSVEAGDIEDGDDADDADADLVADSDDV